MADQVTLLNEQLAAQKRELDYAKHPATGNADRVADIEAAIAATEARIAELTPNVDEESTVDEANAPETTEAPAAPEQAVKPAPKRRSKAAE